MRFNMIACRCIYSQKELAVIRKEGVTNVGRDLLIVRNNLDKTLSSSVAAQRSSVIHVPLYSACMDTLGDSTMKNGVPGMI